MRQRRKQIFVLVSTDHGTMLVNRMDALWVKTEDGQSGACGVGIEILEEGSYQPEEGDLLLGILQLKRQYAGDGVIAVDGGANIGVFTVDWARAMSEWGKVVAFEPQERVYYALAGNITLNNCFNAVAIHSALGNHDGTIMMPVPDYSVYSNFGGLSINGSNENFGQKLEEFASVRCVRIDSLKLDRCDLLKLDIEGMEIDALKGALKTIEEFSPVVVAEHINTGVEPLTKFMEPLGYIAFPFGMNIVFVHRLDKVLDHIQHLHKAMVRSAVAEAEIEEAVA